MRRIVVALIALAAAACGGSGSSGPTEAPLNITASGIASSSGSTAISIPIGGRVHYFNKDSSPHTIVASGTGGCAAALSSGAIPPSGSQLMPVMNSTESCSLSDSTNAALAASVNVIAAPTGGGGGGGSGY